jgi:hypothetical protein
MSGLYLKMYLSPPDSERIMELNNNGIPVIKIQMVEFSSSEREIIAADKDFNQKFSLKYVRQSDLLLLSSEELDLGKVKNLKEKIKTIEDLKYLVNLENVTLALVVEALQSTSFNKADKKPHIVLEVNSFKSEFIK